MFIIKLLSQHVLGIIMPIIRRTRVCTAVYGVLHWLWLLWLCGTGMRAVCTVKVTVNNNNNNYYYYYLLQLGCNPVAVVILHVYNTW